MTQRSPSIRRGRWPQLGLAALFAASGTFHLLSPGFFLRMMPPVLPAPGALVVLSGLAELACAAGLVGGTRWAGPASVALLLAIFPGNIQMALDAAGDPAAEPLWVAAVWLRLPLQVPLIWVALRERRA